MKDRDNERDAREYEKAWAKQFNAELDDILEKASPQMLQVIELVTDDGRKFTYHGKAQFDPDNPPRIVGIVSHPLQLLPENCH